MSLIRFIRGLFKRTPPKAVATPQPIREPAPVKLGRKPKLNSRGVDLIKHFESCLKPTGRGTFRAYPDPAHGWKVPTIGWGTIEYPDGKKVRKGDEITQERADVLLEWEMGEKAESIRRLVTAPLTDDQFSALVAFAYNVGIGNFERSTLLAKLNAMDYSGAEKEFRRWNRAGGQTLDGLTRRRLSEARLFAGHASPVIGYDEFQRMS